MTRCGITCDSDFSDVTKINSDLSIVEIGNGAWQGMVDGHGAVNLDLFRMANLKSIIEGASIDGAIRVFRGFL